MNRYALVALATLLGLSLWLRQPSAQVGPPNQIQCNNLASQAASTTGLVSLVSGVSNKIIVICGWHVTSSSGTASSFQLSQGTGTNCATTNTNVTPAFNVTSNAPSSDHIDFASLSLGSGNNLCIISSATALQPSVWFAQF